MITPATHWSTWYSPDSLYYEHFSTIHNFTKAGPQAQVRPQDIEGLHTAERVDCRPHDSDFFIEEDNQLNSFLLDTRPCLDISHSPQTGKETVRDEDTTE